MNTTDLSLTSHVEQATEQIIGPELIEKLTSGLINAALCGERCFTLEVPEHISGVVTDYLHTLKHYNVERHETSHSNSTVVLTILW